MSKIKKTLAVLLALVMTLSLLAGCTTSTTTPSDSSSSSSTTDTDSTDSNADRVLNVAASGDTGTLYPLALSGGFVSLQYAFYDPLWTFKSDGSRVWMLATAYDQVSEIEFTLKLREGVQFSNGNPMTADDVLFSMEMCKDDARFYLNVGYVDFDKTNIVDDYTIDVWYTEKSYTQDNSFSQLMIMDKESFDMEALSTNPIGTGPYICTDYVVNSHVSCVANENYWGGEPAVKAIEFKVINETAQIVNALEVGDIDISSGVPVDEIDYIESLGYDIDTFYGGYANTALYSFAGALSSKEARYAVSYAMDRESMAQLMYKGISSVPSYPTSEHCSDYEERFSNISDIYATGYNVEKAKQYAEESGLVGKTLKIITNGVESYNDMAAVIQANLADIGVNSEIVSYDSATYFSVVMDESNFDIALFYLSAPSLLACDIMASYLDFIPLGWYDDAREEYRDLCTQILGELDDAKRADLTYQALVLFEEYDPWYAISEAVTAAAIRICTGTKLRKII
jgi:peptide/nickel transport system substrate-binding protein